MLRSLFSCAERAHLNQDEYSNVSGNAQKLNDIHVHNFTIERDNYFLGLTSRVGCSEENLAIILNFAVKKCKNLGTLSVFFSKKFAVVTCYLFVWS